MFMQDSMRKLILKHILIKESLDSSRDKRILKDLIDIRSTVHVNCQHLGNEIFKFP